MGSRRIQEGGDRGKKWLTIITHPLGVHAEREGSLGRVAIKSTFCERTCQNSSNLSEEKGKKKREFKTGRNKGGYGQVPEVGEVRRSLGRRGGGEYQQCMTP